MCNIQSSLPYSFQLNATIRFGLKVKCFKRNSSALQMIPTQPQRSTVSQWWKLVRTVEVLQLINFSAYESSLRSFPCRRCLLIGIIDFCNSSSWSSNFIVLYVSDLILIASSLDAYINYAFTLNLLPTCRPSPTQGYPYLRTYVGTQPPTNFKVFLKRPADISYGLWTGDKFCHTKATTFS